MPAIYRVSYTRLHPFSLSDAGIGELTWDDNGFVLTKNDATRVTFDLSSISITTERGGRSTKRVGKVESNFCLTNTTTKESYNISFIGSQDSAVIGFNRADADKHAMEFVEFVAQNNLTKDSNFQTDGTFNHRGSNILFFILLAVFLIGFVAVVLVSTR